VIWDDSGLTIVLGNQAIHLDPLAVLLGALAVVLGIAFVVARKRKSRCRWQRLPEGGHAILHEMALQELRHGGFHYRQTAAQRMQTGAAIKPLGPEKRRWWAEPPNSLSVGYQDGH
jgi:hypothetical protein